MWVQCLTFNAVAYEKAHIMSDPEFPIASAAQASAINADESTRKSRKQEKQAEKRRAERHNIKPNQYKVQEAVSCNHPTPSAEGFHLHAASLPAAKGAYVGLRQPQLSSQEPTLDNLLDQGFRLLEWNGV